MHWARNSASCISLTCSFTLCLLSVQSLFAQDQPTRLNNVQPGIVNPALNGAQQVSDGLNLSITHRKQLPAYSSANTAEVSTFYADALLGHGSYGFNSFYTRDQRAEGLVLFNLLGVGFNKNFSFGRSATLKIGAGYKYARREIDFSRIRFNDFPGLQYFLPNYFKYASEPIVTNHIEEHHTVFGAVLNNDHWMLASSISKSLNKYQQSFVQSFTPSTAPRVDLQIIHFTQVNERKWLDAIWTELILTNKGRYGLMQLGQHVQIDKWNFAIKLLGTRYTDDRNEKTLGGAIQVSRRIRQFKVLYSLDYVRVQEIQSEYLYLGYSNELGISYQLDLSKKGEHTSSQKFVLPSL